jgi:hypothetical protein
MDAQFTCVWEFEVPVTADAEFRRHYGPNGSWATLFRQDPAYIETLLLHDSRRIGRYLTVDRWRSASAYQSFRQRFAEQYDALDRACEKLTSREVSLGEFRELASERPSDHSTEPARGVAH